AAATAIVGATSVAAAAPVLPSPGGARRAEPEEDEEGDGNGKWWAIGVVALLLIAGVTWGILHMNKTPDAVMVVVPNVVGKDQAAAETILTNKGFVVGKVDEAASATVDKGLISAQDPGAADSKAKGSAVNLTVSTGPEAVTMPDVRQLQYDVAKQQLEGDQYKFKVTKKEVDDTAPAGQVLNTTPLTGQSVQVGSKVTLFVSKGQVSVPNLVGMTEDDAKSALRDLGLKANVSSDPTSTDPAGQVISQGTPQGTKLSPGDTVDFTISDAPDPGGTDTSGVAVDGAGTATGG
ncbi:MAG: PASTA domain-containing protein, partial [Aeromicrobium sp.]